MRTPDLKTVPMRVSITYPDGRGSSAEDRCVSLRIDDENASITVVEMQIPFAVWTQIQSTLSAVVPAEVCGLDKVGKVMEHEVRQLGRSASEAEIAEVVIEYDSGGWESVTASRSNIGPKVTARRWVTRS